MRSNILLQLWRLFFACPRGAGGGAPPRYRYRIESPYRDFGRMGREFGRMGREYGRIGREYGRKYGREYGRIGRICPDVWS